MKFTFSVSFNLTHRMQNSNPTQIQSMHLIYFYLMSDEIINGVTTTVSDKATILQAIHKD